MHRRWHIDPTSGLTWIPCALVDRLVWQWLPLIWTEYAYQRPYKYAYCKIHFHWRSQSGPPFSLKNRDANYNYNYNYKSNYNYNSKSWQVYWTWDCGLVVMLILRVKRWPPSLNSIIGAPAEFNCRDLKLKLRDQSMVRHFLLITFNEHTYSHTHSVILHGWPRRAFVFYRFMTL